MGLVALNQAVNAVIDRDAAAQHKNAHSRKQREKKALITITIVERGVGRTLAAADAEEQQELVARVGQCVHGLGEHRA